MKRRLKISICLMAASLAPLMLAGGTGLMIAVTIGSLTIGWVIARETGRRAVLAALGATLGALVLVTATQAETGMLVVLLADWVLLCTALLVLDGISPDAPPRRTLGTNLRVTAIVSLLFAVLALLSDQETLLTAGLAASAAAAATFALALRSLADAVPRPGRAAEGVDER